MTDPWERFARDAPACECAGYFERAAGRDGPGRAWWFLDGADHLVIDTRSRLPGLRSRTDRLLARKSAGALGYVTFDAAGLFEEALRSFPRGSPFPLGEFALVDHLDSAPVPVPLRRVATPRFELRPRKDTLGRSAFERSVRALVHQIRDGESFQVVLSHRREWPAPDDLFRCARALRRAERYVFFYLLKFGDRFVIGASPESVAELRGRRAWVDPIAGTVPHGDGARRLPLRSDPKELAEHRMLVDLARNDLGAVATPGSVTIPWRERRLRYARLSHLVSRVAGTVRREVGPWELLASTFPAGTVSGAPKIRSVELLRAQERTWRGPYAGAVGLLLPGSRASWALAIRTAFAAGRTLYTAAGAGIVHRSEPAREYDESLAKLSLVESVFAAPGAR